MADPHYKMPEHLAWRDKVLRQAGFRCEWVEDGRRCDLAAPEHRLFADHIIEIQDGGAELDPANGRCLCGGHHTRKTNIERAKRTARPA